MFEIIRGGFGLAGDGGVVIDQPRLDRAGDQRRVADHAGRPRQMPEAEQGVAAHLRVRVRGKLQADALGMPWCVSSGGSSERAMGMCSSSCGSSRARAAVMWARVVVGVREADRGANCGPSFLPIRRKRRRCVKRSGCRNWRSKGDTNSERDSTDNAD